MKPGHESTREHKLGKCIEAGIGLNRFEKKQWVNRHRNYQYLFSDNNNMRKMNMLYVICVVIYTLSTVMYFGRRLNGYELSFGIFMSIIWFVIVFLRIRKIIFHYAIGYYIVFISYIILFMHAYYEHVKSYQVVMMLAVYVFLSMINAVMVSLLISNNILNNRLKNEI